MKLKKIILVSILLLFTLSLGVVCATDGQTSDLDNIWENMDNIQSETSDDILTDEIQTLNIDDSKLTTSNKDVLKVEENSDDNIIVGESETRPLGGSDNVNVFVSNVFKGQEMTISVTASKATGTVNITVGEKTYTPEFVSGIARQSISEYNIGLNNVTVRYNDIVKETSFKGLDGVITNETFGDYYELIKGNYIDSGKPYQRYKMFSYIPEGAILDFRGLINITNVESAQGGYNLTIISSTKDAIIDGNIRFNTNTYITDINITGHMTIKDGTNLSNANVGKLRINGKNKVDNVVVKSETTLNGNDISISNSKLLGGLTGKVKNLTVRNCIVCGDFFNSDSSLTNALIEDNFIEGYVYLRGYGFVVRNNIINASGSTYAVIAPNVDYDVFVNNTVYNYGYDYAVYFGKWALVANNTLFSNNFGDNAVKLSSYSYYVTVENNTPSQIPVNVLNTKKVIYDENVNIGVKVNASGNVTIDVNGKRYGLELVDGAAGLIISDYLPGTNVIQVNYVDVVNDIYGFAKSTFYVEKVDVCPVELSYTNLIAGKNTFVNVLLPNDANGVIEVGIHNATHYLKIIQNASGSKNIVTLPSLVEGNYFMNVTFTSDKYVTNSSCVNISFIHEPVYQLTVSNVVMDYNDGSKYNVLITKDGKHVGAGEIVKITFNGKTVEVKTDNAGYATLTLDGAPKTYAIKAEYRGVIASSKVTIKNILKASNISNKKAKQIKFSATLKNSKGKAIIGKKVTFKFKGKIYSAKTNKKGVATITLKNLKVGKYTITSKYGACTVKNTIKIKK